MPGTSTRGNERTEAFRAMDHDVVLAFASASKKTGMRRFFVVTAPGSNARSGETEEDLKAMGFESLVIFQPPPLLGERAVLVASRVLAPPLRRWPAHDDLPPKFRWRP